MEENFDHEDYYLEIVVLKSFVTFLPGQTFNPTNNINFIVLFYFTIYIILRFQLFISYHFISTFTAMLLVPANVANIFFGQREKKAEYGCIR